MKFYHGTTKENWKLIQEEGILFGGHTYHKTGGTAGYRYTYLTPDIEYAKGYGDVLLEVEYEPSGVGVKDKDGKAIDNYGFNPPPGEQCWQFSVFKPIELENIKVYKDEL